MSDSEGTPTLRDTAPEHPAQTPSPHAPGGSYTPRDDSDGTPTNQDCTVSPHRVDDAAEESFQNPEPPKELAELLNADNIGGTVFSKHWLFTTLMRLLEVVFCILVVTCCCYL